MKSVERGAGSGELLLKIETIASGEKVSTLQVSRLLFYLFVISERLMKSHAVDILDDYCQSVFLNTRNE